MNKVQFATAIATAALLVGAAAPAMAATDVNVSGNGAFSGTKVKVSNTTSTKVKQGNYVSNTTVVNSTASTGGNSSNFNTGGVSAISTGPATSTVTVTNGGSSNTAVVSGDCGCISDTTVNVSGNGAFSHNVVKVNNSSWLGVFQKNVSEVLNVVNSKAKTGNNDSSFNTDGGSVVETGAATSNVTVTNEGSTNTLLQ